MRERQILRFILVPFLLLLCVWVVTLGQNSAALGNPAAQSEDVSTPTPTAVASPSSTAQSAGDESALGTPTSMLTTQSLDATPSPTESPTRVPMLYGSAPDAPDSDLQAIVDDVVGNLGGNWGVAVKKLDTGQYATYNGDVQQVTASLYKLWVLEELFRQAKAGLVQLDGYSTVTSDDTWEDSQSGGATMGVGDAITLRRAAYMMITISDNTAAHLLVRNLGPDNVNRFMQQNGLKNSFLDWYGNGDNLTTPIDVLHELEMIATSQMVDAEASKQMVDIMLDQTVNNILAPGLPDGIPFAHKHGNLDALLHDAGIVWGPSGPFIIVAMSSNLDSFSTAYDNMPVLMKRVYDYFNTEPSSPARYFPQTRQTAGHDFLKFWNEYGGMDSFGYALSPEFMSNGVLVQYFQGGRMEWHPANAHGDGLQPQVQLGLVGEERAAQLGLSWQREDDSGDGRYFPQTGQNVTGGFLEYWLNHGGQRRFGFPISPAEQMVSPTDGKPYITQWFQRARMEWHPDLPPGQQIVLGNLGSELYEGH